MLNLSVVRTPIDAHLFLFVWGLLGENECVLSVCVLLLFCLPVFTIPLHTVNKVNYGNFPSWIIDQLVSRLRPTSDCQFVLHDAHMYRHQEWSKLMFVWFCRFTLSMSCLCLSLMYCIYSSVVRQQYVKLEPWMPLCFKCSRDIRKRAWGFLMCIDFSVELPSLVFTTHSNWCALVFTHDAGNGGLVTQCALRHL